MPQKRQWPPTIYNHKGTARARGKDGKLYYFGPYGSDESHQKFAAWLVDQAKIVEKKSVVTVGDICDAWFSANQSRLSEVEKAHYSVTIRSLSVLWGDLEARLFSTVHLEAYRTAIVSGSWLTVEEIATYQARKQKHTLNRDSANRRTTRVKTIWRWAELRELVPAGSYAKLLALPPLDGRSGVPKGKGHSPSTLEDVLRVAEYATPPVGDMLLVQWWCGMRSGEVRIMRTEDIDRTGKVWLYWPEQHKNKWRGEGRVVLIPPEAQIFVGKHMDNRNKNRNRDKNPANLSGFRDHETAKNTNRDNNPDGYLFLTKTGTLFSRTYYTQCVSKACAKAGIKITPYGGRHAARDRLVSLYGPEVARIALGHKHIDTQQLYGERDIRAAIRAFLDEK